MASIFRVEESASEEPPKYRFTQDLHGAISHKTAFFIVLLVHVVFKRRICSLSVDADTVIGNVSN
jgi:hypothetical protein